jgi:dipeptidase D
MQLVSFGPYIINAHSPNEAVEIATVEAFWKFLKAVLAKL